MVNKLVLENLQHRPIRTILSAVVIGVQVTTMLTLVGLSAGLLQDSARRARGTGADIWVRPPGSSPIASGVSPMDERIVGFIEKQPHVALATGSLVHPTNEMLDTLQGIDFGQFVRMSGGFTFLQGGPFQMPDDTIVDEFYARQRNLKAGQTIRLMNHEWRVSGIIEPGKLTHVFVPLKRLQELSANTGKVTQIFVKLDQPDQLEPVLASFKQKMPGYQLYSMEQLTSMFSVNNIPQVRTFISVIIGLSIVVGFLVVFLSMYTAVLERTREIGILKALGATPGFIVGMLMRETMVLALFGSVVGILLSFGVQWVMLRLLPASLPVATTPDWWPRAALIAMIGALLGAGYPGWKAARQDPIEALSYE